MHVTLYKRHSAKCKHRNDKTYKRCDCSVWLTWGKKRKSADTPFWETAQKKARAIERQFEDAELGIAAPQAIAPVLVEDAIKSFLDEKRGQNLDDETISKYELTTRRLLAYTNSKSILFIRDITLPHLTDHRVSWDEYYNSALAKRENQRRLRSFFRYCEDAGWLVKNPAAKLTAIKVKKDERVATLPFEPGEMDRILAAVPKCNFTPECAQRVRALILAQRYVGVAIQDGIKLPRPQITPVGNDHRVVMKRTKTGVGINNLIQGWVGQELLATPNQNPKYLLWTGKGKAKSAVAYFQRLLKKVFKEAEIVGGHSHRFRDTFAVELLLAGVEIRKVSKALGHDSVATTEKYYGAWCKRQQQSLDDDLRAAWGVNDAGKRQMEFKQPGSSAPRAEVRGVESGARGTAYPVQ